MYQNNEVQYINITMSRNKLCGGTIAAHNWDAMDADIQGKIK